MVAALYAGWIGTDASVSSALQVIKWASPASLAVIVLTYAAWRWIPPIQRMIFPYLGGLWEGEVRFLDKAGQPDRRSVTLEANHTLFGARLLLESDETESKTLAVHAEKDPDFDRFRLYYVYLNKRKEGVAGAGDTYRGTAIVRCELGKPLSMEGDYFTDTHRRGTLHLRRISKTAFWQLWK